MLTRSLITLAAVAAAFLSASVSAAPFTVSEDNLFLLEQDGEQFFPHAANAGFLLRDSYTDVEIETMLAELAEAGVNCLRVNLEEAVHPDAPLSELLESNGEFRGEILDRFDRLLGFAEARGMPVMPIFIDLQRAALDWPASRYNEINGGPVESIADLIGSPVAQTRVLRRVEQIVSRFQRRNILAWELARGVNVWNREAIPIGIENQHGLVWINLLKDRLRRVDNEGHLVAISFLPNTLPYGIMATADIVMPQIRSGSALQTAKSAPGFIAECRKAKRVTFIAECHWTGDNAERDEFVQTLLWSSLALNSGLFLSPVDGDRPYFTGSDFLASTARSALARQIDFSGPPRPPSKAPIQLSLPDEFVKVENIVSNDRLVWLKKETPGEGPAQMRIDTVQGEYLIFWYDIAGAELTPPKTFSLGRNYVYAQTPDFERDVFGVVRLMERRKAGDEKSDEAEGADEIEEPDSSADASERETPDEKSPSGVR